ncbi:MAG: PD-(D/E)XK nuclease family protein [Oscillospiraceae bacterium]|nr:PD-(D/E)XK nuclease family protein [Oscillospiraceae bacterium]
MKFLFGRTENQLTQALLHRISAGAAASRFQLLIVPEQISHDTERQLCAVAGNTVCRHAEVLSFTRLADRVFTQKGGGAAPALDAGGRLLVMRRALDQLAPRLHVYAASAGRASFVRELLRTAEECRQCRVTPEQLSDAAAETGSERLAELSLLLAAYEGLTAQLAADPRDRLDRLADALETCPFAEGMEISVCGFTDFTAQEYQILTRLLRQAEEMTVALVCDHPEETEGGFGVFSPARRTAARLMRIAEQAGVPVETEYSRVAGSTRPEALEYADRHLFDGPAEPCEAAGQEACVLYQAPDPAGEVSFAAAEILRLTRQEGYRFRDVVVTARGIESYLPQIEQTFDRCGIPVYVSRRTDILQKPLALLLTEALHLAAGGYRHETLFRYLKTGLAGIDRDDCDRLENYALMWDLRPGMWSREKPWTMHPRGYREKWKDEDTALLERLNGLRTRIIAPLEEMRRNSGDTARSHAQALCDFMEAVSLPERLQERGRLLMETGRRQLSEEYVQLWEIVCGALDQFVEILGDMPVTDEEFAELFSLLLSQYDVGTIPAALDQVHVCELDRAAHKRVKCILLLGASDDAIPRAPEPAGLLTDEDRALLGEMGLTLTPGSSERLCRELTIAREACAAAGERLAVTWPAVHADGGKCLPSILVRRLLKLLPEAARSGDCRYPAAPLPALEWAAAHPAARGSAEVFAVLDGDPRYAPRTAAVRRSAALRRGALSPQVVERLYGDRVNFSASKMNRFKACHFGYFMHYGLRAKPRETASLDTAAIGTIVHFVLEHVLRQAEKEGGVRAVSDEWLLQETDRWLDAYAQEKLGGLEDKTARFRYLFQRLRQSVWTVVQNAVEELRASDFRPIAFELGFGDGKELPPVLMTENGMTIAMSGIVDRVDGWVKNDRLYLRVVDYKSGRQSFDLTDIWYGMGLQMLLYLFTLEEKGRERFHREIVPAGVLYLPARETVVKSDRHMTPQKIQKEIDKELCRKGLVLDDPDVLEAMEHTDGQYRFLPLKVTAAGEITGDALVSAARLGKLHRHTAKIMRDICTELRQGDIRADPWYKGDSENACRRCEYARACHFDDTEDRRHWLKAVKEETFWAAVEKE